METEMLIGEIMLWLIIAYIGYSFITFGLSFFKPFHRRMRSIVVRERYADTKPLQQLRLEKKWLEHVAEQHFKQWRFSQRIMSDEALQTAWRKSRRIVLAKVKAEELKLPTAHTPLTTELQFFYAGVSKDTLEAIQSSPYQKSVYIPLDVLPYPVDYTTFATDTLVHDGMKPLFDARALLYILTNRVIDIDSSLLPTEAEANERVGLRYINKTQRV